jgi:multidrug resistance efflux pump
MGRIVSIPVHEGQQLRAGQVLVEVDSRETRTQVQKAQAGLKEAQAALTETEQAVKAAESASKAAEAKRQLDAATFDRYQRLLERSSVSRQEFDEAKARFQVAEAEAERSRRFIETLIAKKSQVQARIEQARAEVANTQVYVGYSRVVSPINGVVIAKQAEVGMTAMPGAPLLIVEDNSQYRLEASVEESRIGTIRLGNRVQVKVDSIGQDELAGTVAEIAPSADPSTRSYTVKIDLPSHPSLRSGAYGIARFPLDSKLAITVPQSAIVQHGQLTILFVVDGGLVHMRLIKTGKTSQGQVEVLSGLSEGELVVTSDASSLSDGSRVQ